MKFIVTLVTALFFVLCACPQIVFAEEQAGSSPEKYIARFGDDGITYAEFENYIKSLEQRQGMRANKFARDSILKQMITKRMTYKHALATGFDKDPGVREKIRDATVDIIFSSYFNKFFKPAETTEEEVREYYEKNIEKFSVPELYNGAVYSVYKKGKAGEDFSAKSLDIANEIRTFIADNNFPYDKSVTEEFSRRYPDFLFNSDPLTPVWKGKGIDLPAKIVEEFFKLKAHGITVVDQDEYYAVVAVSDITPAKPDDFQFVKNKVIAEADAEKYRKAYDRLYEELAAEYNLTVDKDTSAAEPSVTLKNK